MTASTSAMATTATAGKVSPMTTAMISMSAAMATAIAATGIKRIGRNVSNDTVIKYARWRGLT